MTEPIFQPDDVWYGGFYELSMEIGERSDERLFDVLQAVWTHPALEGCYQSWKIEPSEQQKVKPTRDDICGGCHLHGVATLPNQSRVACGTVPVREGEDASSIDWLSLYLPLGSLGVGYKEVKAYPYEDFPNQHDKWRKEVDNWFNDIAQYIYQSAHFRFGLIGDEVSGGAYASWFENHDPPEVRRVSYLLERDNTLKYYPFNKTGWD